MLQGCAAMVGNRNVTGSSHLLDNRLCGLGEPVGGRMRGAQQRASPAGEEHLEDKRDWLRKPRRVRDYAASAENSAGNLPDNISGEFRTGTVWRRGNGNGDGDTGHARVCGAEKRIWLGQGNRDWGWRRSGRSWGVVSGIASPWSGDGLRAADGRWAAPGGREEEQVVCAGTGERGREAGRPRGAQGEEVERKRRSGDVRTDESGKEFGELRRGSGSLRIIRGRHAELP